MLNSIIFNIQNNQTKKNLLITIKSIVQAVIYENLNKFELIILCNQDASFINSLLKDFNNSLFVSVRIFEGLLSSLNTSINTGIINAKGEFLFFVDEKDVICYNYFQKIISERNKNFNKKFVYYSEFYMIFSKKEIFYIHHSESKLSPLLFFNQHPFNIKPSSYKDTFLSVLFLKNNLDSNNLFIDWNYNVKFLEKGYKLHIVKDTILFSRNEKRNSSKDLSLFSSYFYPKIYTNLCRKHYLKYRSLKIKNLSNFEQEKNRIFTLKSLFHEANKIEPNIFLYKKRGENIKNYKSYLNIENALSYYEISSIIQDIKFNHILIIPFFSMGGGEKYISSILDVICQKNQLCRILILTGCYYNRLMWNWKFPCNVLHIDLSIFIKSSSIYDHYDMIMRLLESTTTKNSVIHIFPSKYSHDFISEYRKKLKKWNFVFYIFSKRKNKVFYKIKKSKFIKFLEENQNLYSYIISDNKHIFNIIKDSIPAEKIKTIYSFINISREILSDSENLNPRIFWASRIDKEKRPDLIPIIGNYLYKYRQDKIIEVYGYSVFENYSIIKSINNSKNIKYNGSFNEINSLPTKNLDIFLYTSYYDGIPNVILEAIASGMVVIAPNIGGIGEIIQHNITGILLPSINNKKTMAKTYVNAILDIIDDREKKLKLVFNAQKILKKQHSFEIFSQNVEKIFF